MGVILFIWARIHTNNLAVSCVLTISTMDRSDVSIITIFFLIASEKADITACSTKPTLRGKFVPNQWLVYYSYLCYYIKAIFSGICRFYRRTRRLVSGRSLLVPRQTHLLVPVGPSGQVSRISLSGSLLRTVYGLPYALE